MYIPHLALIYYMLPCYLFMIHFWYSFFGEIFGFSSSEATIQHWEPTSRVMVKIKCGMGKRVKCKEYVVKPRKEEPFLMKRQQRNATYTWLTMFIPSECIISLSSLGAQKHVQKNVLQAEQVGKLQAERFIKENIKSNDVGFYETKRNKLRPSLAC